MTSCPSSLGRSDRRSLAPAFTLVELLVVVGIIAVLIALLLPTLNKVRQQAETVRCAANLRSIGQGLFLYAGANQGSLPYGYWQGGASYDGSRAGDWTTLVAAALNPQIKPDYDDSVAYTAQYPGSRGIFLCPSAQPATTPGLLTHYSAHPRLIPSINQIDTDPDDGPLPAGTQHWYLAPYRLAQIRRASEIALIFDGSLKSASGGMPGQWGANVVAQLLDGYRLWPFNSSFVGYDTYLTDDYTLPGVAGEPYMTPGNPIDISWNGPQDINRDEDGNWGNVRFRHGTSDQANVLYADGHVATSTLKSATVSDLLRKNINVNYVHNVNAY